MRALTLLIALLAGCSSVELDPQYRPLTTLREGSPLGESAATTLGSTVYVADLDDWGGRLGTPRMHALLMHERVHSIRQHEIGLGLWLWRYLTSTKTAWREEQLGWAVQIQELRRGGEQVNPEGIARLLSDYAHPGGQIVSYEDALAFVKSVLAGRWEE